MKLRKIILSTFASAFVLCSMNNAVFAENSNIIVYKNGTHSYNLANSKKDEILTNLENVQKIGGLTISNVVSSEIFNWPELNDPSKSSEGKTYYYVKVEKGGYIYSDSDNTQFMVGISNSVYDLESEHNIMTTDTGYTCPAYNYDISDRGITAFPSTKNSNGTWSEGLIWQLNFTDVGYTAIRADVGNESYYYIFSETEKPAIQIPSISTDTDSNIVSNDTNSINDKDDNYIDISSMNTYENITAIDALPEIATAVPNSSKVYIDGNEIMFESYNINGSNYFKLRDVAFAMNGTNKHFDVRWNPNISILSMSQPSSKGVVEIVPNTAYTTVGGELNIGDGQTKIGNKTNSPIFIGENSLRMAGYNIAGNNFFKLRDIGKLFNFYVGWDNNSIIINTNNTYND